MAFMIDNSRRRGFTLVEIIIVIAVITIIAALAYPNFQGFMASRRLNGAARQVQGDLLAARMRSVSENREIKVKFINGNQYTMFYDYNNNGQVDTGEAIETRDIHPVYYDVVITPVSGYAPLFYPRGTANTGEITLTGTAGSKTVTVNTVGRVGIN